jgi:hypothetical protein
MGEATAPFYFLLLGLKKCEEINIIAQQLRDDKAAAV